MLKNVPLFADADEDTLTVLVDVLQAEIFLQDDIIYDPGDVADAMYIVLSGVCEEFAVVNEVRRATHGTSFRVVFAGACCK
jgi:CRP-like cAMP-binding protein